MVRPFFANKDFALGRSLAPAVARRVPLCGSTVRVPTLPLCSIRAAPIHDAACAVARTVHSWNGQCTLAVHSHRWPKAMP